MQQLIHETPLQNGVCFPPKSHQRGKGLRLELVTRASQYAKDNSLRVDVICPLAKHLLEKHPELRAVIGNE
jgi:predicted GNAT family acetyltransferase